MALRPAVSGGAGPPQPDKLGQWPWFSWAWILSAPGPDYPGASNRVGGDGAWAPALGRPMPSCATADRLGLQRSLPAAEVLTSFEAGFARDITRLLADSLPLLRFANLAQGPPNSVLEPGEWLDGGKRYLPPHPSA